MPTVERSTRMRSRAMAVVAIILLAGAIVAGAYVLLEGAGTTSTSSQSGCANLSSVTRTKLNESQFGSVTTYDLPSPLRSANSITAAPDGSVWFGENAIPGVAHLFLNGTLLEYPWPFPNSTPTSLCFDRSEIWGIVFWNGLLWASDPANNQLVGMNTTTGAFTVISLPANVIPRFLATDTEDRLWFTETSLPAQIGVVSSSAATPSFYSVPAGQGEYTTSILIVNSSLAYVVTVNPTENDGQVFSFDPLSSSPAFQQVGGNQTLLGPYSVAVADGGLWVGEHDASRVDFFNPVSDQWSFYPTSTLPKLALTLPYYLRSNGTSVWFNEHDANRMAQLTNGTTLTEYAMSPIPIEDVGIGNALTIALDRNLAWFTAWTANQVGFVNDSMAPSFSISSSSAAETAAPGSTFQLQLSLTGTSARPLNLTFSDSETPSSVPQDITFVASGSSFPSLDGPVSVQVTVSVSSATPPGNYLLLATIGDGLTWRSVYLPLTVS